MPVTMITIIVILSLTTHTHCHNNDDDQQLFVQSGGSYDQLLYVHSGDSYVRGPYVLTSIVSGRPEYTKSSNNDDDDYDDEYYDEDDDCYDEPDDDRDVKILFSDNQWIIAALYNRTRYFNPKKDLTPPKEGWNFKCKTSQLAFLDLVVYTVPVTPPPPELSIKSDSVPEIAGLYSLSDNKQHGYPSYTSSHGRIAVKDDRNGYNWYWEDSRTT